MKLSVAPNDCKGEVPPVQYCSEGVLSAIAYFKAQEIEYSSSLFCFSDITFVGTCFCFF